MGLFNGDGSGWAGVPGFGWVKDIKAQQANEKERKKVAAANARLAEALGVASQQYAQQRPIQSAARQEALRNVLGLYQPANDMMREMTGGQYAMDLNAPAQRFPNPYNMELASQQAAYAQQQAARQTAADAKSQESRARENERIAKLRQQVLGPGGGR